MKKDLECCTYQLIKSSKYIIDCPICFDESYNKFIAPCKHSWCMDCHFQLRNNYCPICRKKFNKYKNFDKNPQIKNKNKLINQIKKINKSKNYLEINKYNSNKRFCCIL